MRTQYPTRRRPSTEGTNCPASAPIPGRSAPPESQVETDQHRRRPKGTRQGTGNRTSGVGDDTPFVQAQTPVEQVRQGNSRRLPAGPKAPPSNGRRTSSEGMLALNPTRRCEPADSNNSPASSRLTGRLSEMNEQYSIQMSSHAEPQEGTHKQLLAKPDQGRRPYLRADHCQ